jgi:hypothetical protein
LRIISLNDKSGGGAQDSAETSTGTNTTDAAITSVAAALAAAFGTIIQVLRPLPKQQPIFG